MAKLADRLKALSKKFEEIASKRKTAVAETDSEAAKDSKSVVHNAKEESPGKSVVRNAREESSGKPVAQDAKTDAHVRIVVHDVKEESPAAPKNEDLPDSLSDIDLSDPNALELLLDEGEEEGEELDERAQFRLDAEKTLLSVELSYQKGIEVVGDQICVPGRVPLMPVSLLEILFVVIF